MMRPNHTLVNEISVERKAEVDCLKRDEEVYNKAVEAADAINEFVAEKNASNPAGVETQILYDSVTGSLSIETKNTKTGKVVEVFR